MKTKYEAPQINLLVLCAEDVITSSTVVSGLNKVEQWTPDNVGGSNRWGDLWG